jgi:Tfp pilus assembly pilus retraction ATPase PilT
MSGVMTTPDESGAVRDVHDSAAFDGVTDIHLNMADLARSVVFPGPRRLPPALGEPAKRLAQACERVGKLDFMVWESEVCWRGRRDELAVDGVWVRLRRMPKQAPRLDGLPTRLPPMLHSMLMAPSLSRGGLVYFVGAPGSGKTTSASGTVVSRLEEFGGYAYTVEDPPEMPINGWHGKGYCAQGWVPGDQSANWAEAMKGAVRSQPASTPSILYVGEVRDTESARAMLRAAANGFLVVATGFGTDVVTGLDALAQLTGTASLPSLAQTLRLVVHQRIIENVLVANAMAVPGPSSQVALRIRNGQLNQLVGDVQQQAHLMRLGRNPMSHSG